MSSTDALQAHLQLCEELHQLALEENRFLKERQHAPDSPLVERRKVLLERIGESLDQIKAPESSVVPEDPTARRHRHEVVEKARTRILQILHVQKENEQLILRHSLGIQRPQVSASIPPASTLQKIYDRHR
ncbi:MAG TPA: hypothetical protein PLV87_01090 [Opitutaceae bacterium]|nr:hypothetical protein [Opitutaceae bacterium]